MSKVTPELKDRYVAQIQDLIIMQGRVTVRGVASALKISNGFAHKLIKRAERRNIEEIDHLKLSESLAKSLQKFRILDDRLFRVLTEKNTQLITCPKCEHNFDMDLPAVTNMEKIQTLREIGNNEIKKFKLLFDGGIFKRNLGDMSVTGGNISTLELIGLILEKVNDESKAIILGIIDEYTSKERARIESEDAIVEE